MAKPKQTKPAKTKKTASEPNVQKRKRTGLSRFKKPADYVPSAKKLSGSFRLMSDSLSFLRQEWKIFGGILIIYFVLSFVLGGGARINEQLAQVEQGVDQTFSESDGQAKGLKLLGSLLNSGGPTSKDGAAYSTLLIVIISLATIWALRQRMAGESMRIRDAFYKGMYPLVPVLLVLLVILVQLIPFMIGGFIYSLVFSSVLAVSSLEKLLWLALLSLLTLLSLYLVTSSVFALYISSLPDMAPMKSLRAARKLVRFSRWKIMRRLLFMPFALFAVGTVLLLPWLWLLPAVAPWVYLLLLSSALIASHSYLYHLYRELL